MHPLTMAELVAVRLAQPANTRRIADRTASLKHHMLHHPQPADDSEQAKAVFYGERNAIAMELHHLQHQASAIAFCN